MNKGQISSQDKKLKDGKLDLYFEGNYVLSLFDKFKYINKRIDKKNPFQVSIFLFIVGWLIPCILAILNNVFFPWGKTDVKCFSFDLSMYAFYMFSLPILLYSENKVSKTLSGVVKFAQSNKILNINEVELKKYIDDNNKWAKSPIIHISSLVFAYGSSIWWIWLLLSDGTNTWHGWNGALPSLPGFYVSLVSIPIGLYVIYVWTLKSVIWIFFVKKITKEKDSIKVNPYHVDGCGGLLFFNRAIQSWVWLMQVIGFLIFLDYFNYVLIQGASVYRDDLMAKVIVYIIIAPCIFILPQLFLRRHLKNVKWRCLDDLTKIGFTYADIEREQTIGVVNRNKFSSINGTEVEKTFNKVRSMRLWPYDIETLTKYMVPVVIALTPTIVTAIITVVKKG